MHWDRKGSNPVTTLTLTLAPKPSYVIREGKKKKVKINILINLNLKNTNIKGEHFIISLDTFLMSHPFDMSCFFWLQFVFMHVRIIAKSACHRCHVRLSPYMSADPSGRIRVKLDTGDFLEKLLRNSTFG